MAPLMSVSFSARQNDVALKKVYDFVSFQLQRTTELNGMILQHNKNFELSLFTKRDTEIPLIYYHCQIFSVVKNCSLSSNAATLKIHSISKQVQYSLKDPSTV